MKNTIKIQADKYRIVKSNKLVNSRQPFSALQQRIITLLASRINPSDEQLKEHTFDISEFYMRNNGNIGGQQYHDVKKALNGLMDGKIEIETFVEDGSREWVRYNLFSKAKYVEKTKTACLSFAPDMRTFFLHLKGNYTSYFLKDVNSFNKTYTIRIYELCKQYFPQIKERKIDLEQLKFLLAIDGKYSRWSNFREKVLDQSIKEINDFSDLTVSFKTEIQKRKVVAVIFKISGKATCEVNLLPPKEEEQSRISNEVGAEQVEKSSGFKLPEWLNEKQYANLLSKGFGKKEIQQGIEAIEFKNNVKVPSAYLYKGLKAGWFASKEAEEKVNAVPAQSSQATKQRMVLEDLREKVTREFDQKRNELLNSVNVDEDAVDEFVFAFDGTEDRYMQKCVNQLSGGELSDMNRKRIAVWLINNEEESYSEEELMLANSRIEEYAKKNYGLKWK
ncbi:MAG: replication initiation protein [Cytophagales bacterium]|nr:replication initiation protein [Cytophagales bacterium]